MRNSPRNPRLRTLALRIAVFGIFLLPVSLVLGVRYVDAGALERVGTIVREGTAALVSDAKLAGVELSDQLTAAVEQASFWDWLVAFMGFGGAEETAPSPEQNAVVDATIGSPPTTAPQPAAPPVRTTTVPVPPTTTTKVVERVLERTVVEPTYTTVVLPDAELEKRVEALEQRPASQGAAIAIPVFNHEEGNDNTFTNSTINTPSINGGTIVNLSGLGASNATITAATTTTLHTDFLRATSGQIDSFTFGSASTSEFLASNATITSATTTSFYATLGRFAEAIFSSLSATYANITTLVASSATLGNASSTNATTTNLYVSGQTTIGALSGFLKATAGVVSTALVNLASDVTGILPVSSGGTGWAALASGFIPFGNGTGALATSSALFFDSENERLGVGTTSPIRALAVSSSANSSLYVKGTASHGGIGIENANTKAWFIESNTESATSNGFVIRENPSGAHRLVILGDGGGNVGIGTSTPGAKLQVLKTTEQLRLSYDQSNFASFTIGSTGMLSIVPSGGNVGIGTTSPGQKLEVNGAIKLGVPGNKAYSWVTDTNGMFFRDDTNNRFPFKIDAGAYDNALVIGSTGNVGIGTTTPLTKLSVAGTTGDLFTLNANTHAANDTAGLYFSTDDGVAAKIQMVVQGSGNNTNDRELAFFTTTDRVTLTEALRITHGGNIGIGTSSPATKLHVNGGTLFDSNSTGLTSGYRNEFGNPLVGGTGGLRVNKNTATNGDKIFSAYHPNSGGEFSVSALSGSAVEFGFTGGEIISSGPIYSSDGSFGDTEKNDYIKFTNSDDSIRIFSNASERVTVLTGGNVGIGDTSPDFKLDVYGTICQDTDSNDTCDGTVTSDARLKENVATIENALDIAKALRGVRFDWRQDLYPSNQFGTSTQIGFVAQEVETVAPEVVNRDGDGFLWIDYQKITAVLANALSELSNKLDALTATVAGFAHVFRTEQLCVKDASGETCLTRSDVNAILSAVGQQSPAPSEQANDNEQVTDETPEAPANDNVEEPPAPVEAVIL